MVPVIAQGENLIKNSSLVLLACLVLGCPMSVWSGPPLVVVVVVVS